VGPAFFVSGHRYRVKQQKKCWLDSFTPGEVMIYTGSASSVRDGAIGFFFYDIVRGNSRRFDLDLGDEKAFDFGAIFEDQGEEMEYRDVPVPEQAAEHNNFDFLRPHVEYLKDLVEGKEPIKSWYVWLEENAASLQANLTRIEFIRFKTEGYGKAMEVLDAFQIPYKRSPLYGWLGGRTKLEVAPLP